MLEYVSKEWDYRVLPNKMYELVRNTGSMYKEGTGYITDAESEMITILAFLNDGEKTNITESMIEQIKEAIKNANMKPLFEEEENMDMTMPTGAGKIHRVIKTQQFVQDYIDLTGNAVAVIKRFVNGEKREYKACTYDGKGNVSEKTFSALDDCRGYLNENGLIVRIRRDAKDEEQIVEAWV